MRILIVEDNQPLVTRLFEYFEPRGHTLDTAFDGDTGLQLASTSAYDVMVLDWSIPRLDGLAVLRRIRSGPLCCLPVLMLSARAELADKLAGFQAGADDYLTIPFAMAELEVRLLALEARASARGRSNVLQVEDLVLDLATLQATRGGTPVHLYPACRKILQALLSASPAPVTRSQLEEAVWGNAPPACDMLRSHIYELRRSIDMPFEKKLIHTFPHVGYRLVALETPVHAV